MVVGYQISVYFDGRHIETKPIDGALTADQQKELSSAALVAMGDLHLVIESLKASEMPALAVLTAAAKGGG